MTAALAIQDPNTALVARAFAGARIACGEPSQCSYADYPRQVRVLAGAALFRANLMTAKAAARDCHVGESNGLSPSQIGKAAVTEELIRVVIAYVKEGLAPALAAEAPPEPAKAPSKPMKRKSAARSTLRRFEPAEIDPEAVVDLRADHPAARDGHSMFKGQVVGARDGLRLLVSGHNSPKLGKEVLKGPRTGWPIFHLTLEERATCPRSCPVWAGCYGNAMPFARRHRADAELMKLLRAEVLATAKMYPNGFLVRLHNLGDFFSVPYVLMWAELLAAVPALHVFGYTARREDDADPETQKIARAIRLLTDAFWDRFAIRTSHGEFGPKRSVVVMADPRRSDVIVCPAQTKATEACATCGLCWAGAARPKTIAFLKHGMKRRARGKAAEPTLRKISEATAPPSPPAPQPLEELTIEQIGERLSLAVEGPPAGFPESTRRRKADALHAFMVSKSDGEGRLRMSRKEICEAADVPLGSWAYLTEVLRDAGRLVVEKAVEGQPATFRLYLAPGVPAAGPAPAPRSVPNPCTPRKARFCRWFLAANWREREVADLFDVEVADMREALGGVA